MLSKYFKENKGIAMTLLMFALIYFGKFLQFGAYVFAGRLLEPSEFGKFSLLVSITAVLSIFVIPGFEKFLYQKLPVLRGEKRWAEALAYLKTVYFLSIKLMVGVICLLVGLYCFEIIGVGVSFEMFTVFLVLIPLWPLLLLNRSFIYGYDRRVLAILPDYFITHFLFFAGILYLCFFYTESNSLHVSWVYTGSYIISVIVGFFLIRYLFVTDDMPRGEADKITYSALLKQSLLIALLDGFQFLNVHIDLLMLGALGTSEEVGVFRAAQSYGVVILVLLTTCHQIIAYDVSRYYSSKDFPMVQKYLKQGVLIMTGVGIPLLLMLWVFGEWLLRIYGDSYVVGVPALRILTIGYLARIGLGVAFSLLIAAGYNKVALVSWIIGVSTTVILNILLIPTYGINGVAVAASVGTAIACLIMSVYSIRVLKLDPTFTALFK